MAHHIRQRRRMYGQLRYYAMTTTLPRRAGRVLVSVRNSAKTRAATLSLRRASVRITPGPFVGLTMARLSG